jgi:hypothetical protein
MESCSCNPQPAICLTTKPSSPLVAQRLVGRYERGQQVLASFSMAVSHKPLAWELHSLARVLHGCLSWKQICGRVGRKGEQE